MDESADAATAHAMSAALRMWYPERKTWSQELTFEVRSSQAWGEMIMRIAKRRVSSVLILGVEALGRLAGLACLAVIVAILAAVEHAAAQGYPARPITFVVPYAAGGPADRSEERRVGKEGRSRWSAERYRTKKTTGDVK